MRRIMFLLVATLFVGIQAFAQTSISGTVTDSKGEAIPGANVRAKGYADVGTVTDFNGKYTLSVPTEATALIFSFVGMESKEVAIAGQTVVNAALESGDVGLDEVVVTALGVAKEKKALGYAVQNVDGDAITKARETNFVNSLSGQIAGIQVTNSSGAAGASSRIVLRGATSIVGSNEPLFVVDGVPINNTNYGNAGSGGGFDQPGGAADINPDDIETISVLKGANAAALYGSRAANGVILITTKKGTKKKGIGVSVNSTTTFEKPLKLYDFQNSYGQGADNTFFEFIDGQHGAAGVDESWGPPLDVGLEFVQFTSNGQYPEPWVSKPDNVKNFLETGITTTNNVSLAGGGEKSSFRLSLTNMYNKGMVPKTGLNRNTVNLSGSSNLTDKLSATFSASYINTWSDQLPYGGYDNENPMQQVIWGGRQVDYDALKDWENLPLADPTTAAAGTPLNWNTVFQNNPYWVLDMNQNSFEKDRLIGNANVTYKFADWISVRGRVGTDYWAQVEREEKYHGSNNWPDGRYVERYRTWYETNTDLLVMLNKQFTEDFSASLNLGANAMKRNYNRVVGRADGLELPGVFSLSNVKSGTTAILTNYREERAVNSLYYSGQLAYKNYLFLEFTGRNDWSSVLPVDNNSYFYPSFSLSGVITDMVDISENILSYLKVRGSWAQVGGDGALNPYSLQQTFAFRDAPWGDVLLPFNGNTLNNPNLKSETTNSIEFGLDARFFLGRLTLEATYYDSKSEDLLLPIQVSGSTGYLFAWDNVAEIQNKGIEIQLGAKILKLNDFNWDMKINFSTYDNKVISLGGLDTYVLGGQWNMNLEARPGLPYGVIYGSDFERTDDGQIIHDSRGLPKIDSQYKVLGDIQPDWTGGIYNEFSYKGFTLGCLIDAKMGGEIHSMTTTWGRYAGILEETLLGRETGIVGEGVVENADGTYRTNDIVVTAEEYNKRAFSNDIVSSAVFDASYIKLRQVSLSYTFPKNLTGKIFQDLTVSVVGRNLAILYSKVPHIDPETGFSSENGEQGQEFGQLPSARSIGFNINFKF